MTLLKSWKYFYIIQTHNPILAKKEDNIEYSISELSNGITVITEKSEFPSNVHLAILLNVGTRDETHENSGSCLAIKNTYLKTLKHTNETLNYGMTQMAGSDVDVNYDEETMYYRTYAFDYDVTDMFRMLSDMAFEPRSMMNANVAKEKNRQFFELQHHLSHYNAFGKNPEYLLTTAYGYNTLGMPKWGFESNIGNIDAKMLQEFQLSNITPSRITVTGSGVRNHQEFVDLVKYNLGAINPVRESGFDRVPSQYIGGEYRTFTETPETNIILGYESVSWGHRLMPAFAIIHTMFGSAQGFSIGGPGKGMLNRAYTDSNIL
jgi:predicted Zn-dependent peptidase